MQGLGGKFGERICEDLGIQHMGDLIRFSREELQRRYDERNGQWLYNIARGIDLEAVTPRLVSKSIGCCKKFPGRNAISAITTLNHWLHELAKEISERLEQDELENNRRPKQMVVSYIQSINNVDVSSSRTVNLTAFDEEKIVSDAIDVLKRNTEKFFKTGENTMLNNPIKFLGLNVGKFESTDVKKGNTIQDMFQRTMENKKNETNVDESSATEITEGGNPEGSEETPSEASKPKEEKKDNAKESFFAKYYKIQAQKKAEEERQRREEEEATEQQESDDENTFNNEMLMEELEQNNQDAQSQEQKQEMRRSESPAPSTSNADYMQTYAEFYKPSDVPKVECTQCGKKVNAHEIQIHNDEHFAFQLTQEQRIEFQSQLKRNITSTTPAAKKQKTAANNKSKSPQKLASIQKFLVKPSQNDTKSTPTTSAACDVETEKCQECGKNISIVDLFEHMDFHAAKKLQDELMRAEIANRTNNNTIQSSVGKSFSTGKGKKTKTKTSGNSNNNTPNAMKNITSFFKNT